MDERERKAELEKLIPDDFPEDGVVFVIHPGALSPEAEDIFKLFEDGKPLLFGEFRKILDLQARFPLGREEGAGDQSTPNLEGPTNAKEC